jgi:hypothetical protein
VIFGSPAPARFLRAVADGSDSVDIVLIGDSNTGSALYGMWGFHHGLSQTLHDRGLPMYATPVYPAMTASNRNHQGPAPGLSESLGGWRGSCLAFSPAPGSPGSALRSGIASGWSPLARWGTGDRWIRYGTASGPNASTDDWAFIPAGSYSNCLNGVMLDADHPLLVSGEPLWHRVRFGTFAVRGGSLQGAIGACSPPVALGTGPVQSSFGSEGGEAIYEYSVPGPLAPTNVTASWSAGPTGAQGPCAVLSHSVYVRRRGWSVTSHGYLAGQSSAEIRVAIESLSPELLRAHLRDLRDRQVAAGGSGRVLLLAQSGVNGQETPESWTQSHRAIWQRYRAAWTSLGFPAADIAIMSFVSPPRNEADTGLAGNAPLAPVRAAAVAMAAANPDMTVIAVNELLNHRQLLRGSGGGVSLYQRFNGVPNSGPDLTMHLSGGRTEPNAWSPTDGYTMLMNLVVSTMLVSTAPANDTCAGDTNGDGVVSGLDLGQLIGNWGPCN